jgi:prepilin-type N-terminal cleavage/methylation domain-containing protein
MQTNAKQQLGIARGSRRLKAFTMVEVLIAVAVFGVAAISLYAGFGTGFMLVDSAREELRATQILTQKAEALRLCSWSSLSSYPVTFTERYDPTGGSGTNGAGTIYGGTISTNVATAIPDSCTYKTNMCLATITISWTNYSGRQTIPHTRTLQTLVARYGIQNYVWGMTP